MIYDEIVFSRYAITRMFERSILPRHIRQILSSGETIVEYPDDKPFPSRLILGYIEGRPIHVVAAVNSDAKRYDVITAYIPEIDKWNDDFRTRRKP